MDLLLISGRSLRDDLPASERAHPSQVVTAEISGALAARGHDVRWLCMLDEDETAPSPSPDVEFVVTRSRLPGFRHVMARVSEIGAETVLTEQLRARRAEVVHVLAIGSAAPAQLPWICERFDVPSIVDVDLADTVCHRGTLIRGNGRACDDFNSPAECARCCLTPDVRGLGVLGAAFGRAALWLGGLSPWPQPSDFLNRLDVVIGSGLASASRVRVRDDAARDALLAAGLGRRGVTVGQPRGAADLEALYTGMAAAAAGG